MLTLTLLFQTGFNKDSVELFLDGEKQTITKLETDYSTGLAKKLVLPLRGNRKQMKLECANDQSKVELILPFDAEQYVLIDLDDKKKLQLEVTQHAPVYF